MVSVEYANAYSEVLGILKCISEEDYEKIPTSKIDVFETYQNKEYIFQYDPDKTLDEQNVSKIAKVIIGLLFRDYWATAEQREKIISVQNYNREKLEQEKREKYNPDDLFKNKQNDSYTRIPEKEELEENLELVEYKEQAWYQKVFEKIMDFVNKFMKNKI